MKDSIDALRPVQKDYRILECNGKFRAQYRVRVKVWFKTVEKWSDLLDSSKSHIIPPIRTIRTFDSYEDCRRAVKEYLKKLNKELSTNGPWKDVTRNR